MADEQVAWLIEWPHEHGDDGGTRWWHPETGWRFNVDKAIRFARREDAEAYIATIRFCSGVVAVEHSWFAPDAIAKAGAAA